MDATGLVGFAKKKNNNKTKKKKKSQEEGAELSFCRRSEDDQFRGQVLYDGVIAAEKFDTCEQRWGRQAWKEFLANFKCTGLQGEPIQAPQAAQEVSKLRRAVEQRIVLMAGQALIAQERLTYALTLSQVAGLDRIVSHVS
eukprot:6147216-Amphidinium_carterae.2